MASGKKYKHLSRKPICGVYAVLNFRERKAYVGSTREMRKRLLEHKNSLRNGCHTSRNMQADYDRLGRDNFCFLPLELDCDPSTVHLREQFWMDVYGSLNHYNKRPAFKAR